VQVPRKPVEQPVALLEANTQDILYLFMADGRAVSLPVYQLPQARELGSGAHWADLTMFSRRDHLAAALIRPKQAISGYLFLATLGGVVKRVRLEDVPGITSEPFLTISVGDQDTLGWVCLTSGDDEVVLVTAGGQAIRFPEEQVRPMGLAAGGVLGIKLAGDTDGVVALAIAEPDTLLWSITDNGLAKATPLDEYPTQGRYGQGVINVRLPDEAAEVVSAIVGKPDTQIIVTTSSGSTKKLKLKETYVGGRAVKPRSLLTVSARNRVTGAVSEAARPEAAADREFVAKQLPFPGDGKASMGRRRAKASESKG
jgi:DNA gyrase subunit A